MCFSMGGQQQPALPPPPPPPPPAPPLPPGVGDVAASGHRERRLRASGEDTRQGTLLTSPQGIQDDKKTLLGN